MRLIFLFSGLMLLLTACQPEAKMTDNKESVMYQKMDIVAPVATKIPKELTIHGDTRTDDYYWLNERENPEVISFLNAENTYKDEMMSHTKDFQDKLFEEMKGRIKEDDQSVPYKDNGYFYLTSYKEGQEYPVYSRKKGTLEAEEEIMLNVNELAKDFSYFNVGSRSVSPNNELLAYGEDTLSRRIYTIRFKNLKTGEMIEDRIPNTTGGAVWANDNQHVFYAVKDETLRPVKIFRHRLGTPSTDDVLIYEEQDDTFSAFVYKSKSKKYIIIGAYQTLSQEYQVLDADNPTGEFRMIQPRERGLEYGIAHFGDKFYIRTNMDALNFRLMSTPENATTKDNWEEVIPHRKDVLLEGMDIFQDYLVLSERKNGITQLRIRPWEGKEHYIDFGEDAYMAYTSTNPEFDTEVLRIGYQSMTTPATTYDYNMKTKGMELLKQQEVLGGFNSADYVSERLYAKARDGVTVPISIVYHKDFKKDGTQPLLLYAYGSYGYSMDPSFSSARLSLLNRGFAFAIAHIRGGEEMGRHWYEDGKLLNKKNTFNDFIDCGEFLVAEKYAAKDQLYAQGGSAGGLLMGAVMNMRPDLWKGVVAAVPFVDVITTMLDESIPLTTGEYDEWGNPNEKEYYDYILSYSPYDQVEAKDYPATLVTTGLHDSQVQYWEPAKWVAKLREMKTDKNPLLLHTNMDAGHGGASGRFARLKEVALQYSFFLDLAGKNEVKG
ncbi:S9 family peptidase [Lewinella cohaerens]|uniref:S9 family peptidase n=1 Tax=Lewinella cohaerens TaxID=70995 RepID=UPI00037A01D6|nr:oligopeptidase B [Lewinella cohaerens]